MIVKKIPILQGFPAPDTVNYLSNVKNKLSENSAIFYDIETTGLSRYTASVYLIGAVRYEKNQWILYQWMAENAEEEASVLQEFSVFLENAGYTIQYNGNRFDQPFLEERYRKYKMDSPFAEKTSVDLYQLLKPCQSLLKLTRIEVMGHNEEDLRGLGKIFPLLSLRKLYDGEYCPKQCEVINQELKMTLELPAAVPINVSCGNTSFYLTVSDQEAKILVHLNEGKLRQYYRNYKDYEYISGEDTAMPKSISKYMDKSLRVAATPQTCYTWFRCDESFVNDPVKQMQYLTHTLSFFLDNLNK